MSTIVEMHSTRWAASSLLSLTPARRVLAVVDLVGVGLLLCLTPGIDGRLQNGSAYHDFGGHQYRIFFCGIELINYLERDAIHLIAWDNESFAAVALGIGIVVWLLLTPPARPRIEKLAPLTALTSPRAIVLGVILLTVLFLAGLNSTINGSSLDGPPADVYGRSYQLYLIGAKIQDQFEQGYGPLEPGALFNLAWHKAVIALALLGAGLIGWLILPPPPMTPTVTAGDCAVGSRPFVRYRLLAVITILLISLLLCLTPGTEERIHSGIVVERIHQVFFIGHGISSQAEPGAFFVIAWAKPCLALALLCLGAIIGVMVTPDKTKSHSIGRGPDRMVSAWDAETVGGGTDSRSNGFDCRSTMAAPAATSGLIPILPEKGH